MMFTEGSITNIVSTVSLDTGVVGKAIASKSVEHLETLRVHTRDRILEQS